MNHSLPGDDESGSIADIGQPLGVVNQVYPNYMQAAPRQMISVSVTIRAKYENVSAWTAVHTSKVPRPSLQARQFLNDRPQKMAAVDP